MVRSDVLWFKSDTQGNDAAVVEGARGLFQNHNVLMLDIEFDARLFTKMGISPKQFLSLIKEVGMTQCDIPGRVMDDASIEAFGQFTTDKLATSSSYNRDLHCNKGLKVWSQ